MPVVRNIAVNAAGMLVPLLVTFFTVPIYLSQVGNERYGIILIAWAVLGYLGFMDFGISRATTRALAQADPKNAKLVSEIFWTALLTSAAISVAAGAVAYLVLLIVFRNFIQVEGALSGELAGSVPIIAAMLPVTLLTGVGVGASEAREKFAVLNAIQAVSLILSQVVPLLIAIHLGPSLPLILGSMLAFRTLTMLLILAYGKQVNSVGWSADMQPQRVRDLLSFGGWLTLTNIISPVMTLVDTFVIGAVRGVGVVPFYGVPMTLIQRAQILPAVFVRTLFPYFSRVSDVSQRRAVRATLQVLSLFASAIYVPVILCGASFLEWWVGPEMAANGGVILLVLALGAWWNNHASVLFSALQASGRPRDVALVHACEVIPYLVVLWLAVSSFGLLGAAAAWSLRVVVDAIALAALYRPSRDDLLPLVPSLVSVWFAAAVSLWLQLEFLPAAAASAAIWFTTLALALTTSPGLRASVLGLLNRKAGA